MRILVIDGQGGGIGKSLVLALRKALPDASIVAVGTNVLATSAMLKAGANAGATGENAVCFQCGRADVIAGAIGLIEANAMLGEISPRMAEAVSASPAEKVLIPTSRCGLHIAGVEKKPLEALMEDAVALIVQMGETQFANR